MEEKSKRKRAGILHYYPGENKKGGRYINHFYRPHDDDLEKHW
jgi:hypothetical protein